MFAKLLKTVRTTVRESDGQVFRAIYRKTFERVKGQLSALSGLRSCDAVGPHARLDGRVRVDNRGHIEIGARLRMIGKWNPVELTCGERGRIEIGSDVLLNFGTAIRAEQLVHVGDHAMIGQYCILSDSGEADARTRGLGGPQPIYIGDGVWLAGRVTVLPGSVIGAGSVVAAGSIVDGEIPPGVIASGIPARVVRRLDTGQRQAPELDAKRGPALRALLLADFNLSELGRRLEGLEEGLRLSAEIAAPGALAALLDGRPPAGAFDCAVIWTRPQAALPAFARLLAGERVAEAEVLAEVDLFCSRLLRGCEGLSPVFVPAWTLPPWERGLGLDDLRAGGATWALLAANLRLARTLGESPSVRVLPAQRWLDAAGRGAHSAKGWLLGQVPFSAEVFEEAARDLQAALQGLSGGARTLVVVDLDGTLWGGAVGRGWQELRLGGSDAEGAAFVALQRQLQALKRHGVSLAIASSSDETAALEAIDQHPEMVLRRSDFAAWRFGGQDKAQSLAALAAELRLPLRSVVFVGADPAERARLRAALPDLLVPDWPDDRLLRPRAFGSLRCFDGALLPVGAK